MSQNTIKTMQTMTLARAIDLINEQERRIAELEAEKAAVPVAAGNALTDAVKRVLNLRRGTSGRIILELSDELELSNALSKHLRAAPQAAQGEGLTDGALSKTYLKAENHTKGLRAVADRAIAAHARAAGQGKDSERLDWMIHRGAHIAHTMDGEMCNVWLPARRDGTEARPAEGYPQKRYDDGRAAIDAAMKAGAQGGGK